MDAKEAKEIADAAYIAKELPRALHYIKLHAENGRYKCNVYSSACLVEPLKEIGFRVEQRTGFVGDYLEVTW